MLPTEGINLFLTAFEPVTELFICICFTPSLNLLLKPGLKIVSIQHFFLSLLAFNLFPNLHTSSGQMRPHSRETDTKFLHNLLLTAPFKKSELPNFSLTRSQLT